MYLGIEPPVHVVQAEAVESPGLQLNFLSMGDWMMNALILHEGFAIQIKHVLVVSVDTELIGVGRRRDQIAGPAHCKGIAHPSRQR